MPNVVTTDNFLAGYPEGYDSAAPPHDNTLEAAMAHCRTIETGGVTFQYGRYEVRQGNYLRPQKDNPELSSWVLIGE